MNKAMASFMGLAGLFHDIGKLYQKSSRKLKGEYQKEEYRKLFVKNGYSYFHAPHTAQFLDDFSEFKQNGILDNIFKKYFPNEDFTMVSSAHHNPDRYLNSVIAAADRIASGFDRDDKDFDKRDEEKRFYDVRLSPLLKHISLKSDKIDTSYRYEVSDLSFQNIFPMKKELLEQDVKKLYDKIINDFEADLLRLDNLNLNSNNLSVYTDSINYLFEKYTSFSPASTWKDFDDVSLYEHLKTTAAFSSAIYNYFESNEVEKEILNENINSFVNSSKKYFLVIRGEFFGIQKFIFDNSESNKEQAKVLRAKSFYVSLLSEITASNLLDELNLPGFNLMINAAGMFVILAPNTDENLNIINSVKNEINNWLYNKFFGEVSFGLALENASSNDFSHKHFEKIWLSLLEKMEKEKYKKFDLANREALFKDYYKQFDENTKCLLCGKRGASKEELCDLCSFFNYLGTNLVKNRFITISKEENGELLGKYRIAFANEIKGDLKRFLKIFDLDVYKEFEGYQKLYYNHNIPVNDDNGIKTFDEITLSDNGKHKPLAVLKADVDNLGSIFAVGLEPPDNKEENKKLTFSRLTAMSRMMNYFFSVYIPFLCNYEEFENIYTVFAGGDDLFLIGAYDEIFDFYIKVNNEFKRFTGYNNEITISAAIELFPHSTPISYIGERTEKKLSNTKNHSKNQFDKGYMYFLNAYAKPEVFKKESEEFANIKIKTESAIDSKSSFWYKILEFIDMSKNKDIEKNLMWIPRLKYSLGRRLNKDEKLRREISDYLFEKIDKTPELFRAVLSKSLYDKRYSEEE